MSSTSQILARSVSSSSGRSAAKEQAGDASLCPYESPLFSGMTFCLSLLVGVCLPQDGWTESFPGLLAGWMEGRRREHGTALAGMASWIVPY